MNLEIYETIRTHGVYNILDEADNIINTIVSPEPFVKEKYERYEVVRLIVDPDLEREWRNKQLAESDSLMLLADYPNKERLSAWRQVLRDWPNTEDFPQTRPVSFDEFLKQE